LKKVGLVQYPSAAPFAHGASSDLEWKLTYVGSAESESFDQELDTCMVGPVPVGVNSFEFEVREFEQRSRGQGTQADTGSPLQAAAPLPSRIPSSDLIGVTVILLTCSYADQEFVRIGYYVNTEYGDPALKALYDASLEEGAQDKGLVAPDPTKNVDSMVRSVLGEKPRVTKFNISWSVHPL
jgi:histone chaperone ASF1